MHSAAETRPLYLRAAPAHAAGWNQGGTVVVERAGGGAEAGLGVVGALSLRATPAASTPAGVGAWLAVGLGTVEAEGPVGTSLQGSKGRPTMEPRHKPSKEMKKTDSKVFAPGQQLSVTRPAATCR